MSKGCDPVRKFPHDDEAAAAVAAVQAYLAVTQAESGETPGAGSQLQSGWCLATRLEGVGQARLSSKPISRARAWTMSKLLGRTLLVLLLWTYGQNAIADDDDDEPRPAPDFRSTAGMMNPMEGRISPPPGVPPAFATDGTLGEPKGYGDISPAPTPAVSPDLRIGLATNVSACQIGLPDGGVISDPVTGKTLAKLPPQSRWQVACKSPGGYNRLQFSGTVAKLNGKAQTLLSASGSANGYRPVAFSPAGSRLVDLSVQNLNPAFWLPGIGEDSNSCREYVVTPFTDGLVAVGDRLYRGALILRQQGSAPGMFSVINIVNLEDYLLSVVPSEMPATWPLEALKAQSIAARSYALANLGKRSKDGYDLRPTVEDQVYTGVGAERESTNRSVAETSGCVLRHNGNVVTAFFHSTSGGCTELSENVWKKPVPYLKSVPDYDDESPHFNWNKSISVDQLEQSLKQSGKDVGAVLALLPVWRGPSQRIVSMMIAGSDRTIYVSGEEARKLMSLPSSAFNLGCVPQGYIVAGRGFGHGLGMSQWGAKRLAQEGYNAAQILSYYYKDIAVDGNQSY